MIRSSWPAARWPTAAPRSTRRPAFSAMLAIICLAIISVLLGVMLRSVSLAHQQAANQQQKIQANWLAQAGLALGESQWSKDPNYRGEVWTIGASQRQGSLARRGNADAVVKITISPIDDAAVTIQAEVTLPGRTVLPTRLTRAATMVTPTAQP